MKSWLNDRVARYATALYLLLPVYLLALALWKLPSLALAAGAILATVAIFVFMQTLLSSSAQERQWHGAVVMIGQITSVIVALAVFTGCASAILFFYPFQPLAELTLGAVLVNFFGIALFAAIPASFGEAFYKALRVNLFNAGQFGLYLGTFVAAALIVYRQMS